MQFHEDGSTHPDPTRWTADTTWQEPVYKGTGLFDDFVVLPQVSGYFRLYFATGEGFEHIGDYFHFEEVEEAVLKLLGSMTHVPGESHADAQ